MKATKKQDPHQVRMSFSDVFDQPSFVGDEGDIEDDED